MMNRVGDWLLALGFVLGNPGRGPAQSIPAVNYTSGSSETAGAQEVLGYAFTVGGSNLRVDALGVQVSALSSGTTVRIYQDGTTTTLASVIVSASDPLSADGKFRFHSLPTPLDLTDAVKYDMVAEFGPGQGFIGSATGIMTVQGITFNNGVGAPGTNSFPTMDTFGTGPYFGPTFEVQPVPEPSSLALVMVAAAVVGLRARRRWAGAPAG